jgi:hypothetical protein
MQGIYNYIPETNHVSRVYSISAVLYLQSVLHVKSFRPWNRFCSFTLALSAVCVQCPIWLFFFWQFLNFVLSRYVAQLLSEWFWNASSRPCYYRYHFCFHIPHALNSILRSLYFKIFSAFFLITFLSPEIYYYYYYNTFHHLLAEYSQIYTWHTHSILYSIPSCRYSAIKASGENLALNGNRYVQKTHSN